MLQKKPVDASTVEVTFRISTGRAAQSACVAGEFNDWSTVADPMSADADGFATTVRLEPGRRYRFRYVLDGHRWENEWAADAYAANDFGGEDSVVDLTGVAVPDPLEQPDPRYRTEQQPAEEVLAARSRRGNRHGPRTPAGTTRS